MRYIAERKVANKRVPFVMREDKSYALQQDIGTFDTYTQAHDAVDNDIKKRFNQYNVKVDCPRDGVWNVFQPKQKRYSTQANMLATYVIKEVQS